MYIKMITKNETYGKLEGERRIDDALLVYYDYADTSSNKNKISYARFDKIEINSSNILKIK